MSENTNFITFGTSFKAWIHLSADILAVKPADKPADSDKPADPRVYKPAANFGEFFKM